jgi:hypothetical protein
MYGRLHIFWHLRLRVQLISLALGYNGNLRRENDIQEGK